MIANFDDVSRDIALMDPCRPAVGDLKAVEHMAMVADEATSAACNLPRPWSLQQANLSNLHHPRAHLSLGTVALDGGSDRDETFLKDN